MTFDREAGAGFRLSLEARVTPLSWARRDLPDIGVDRLVLHTARGLTGQASAAGFATAEEAVATLRRIARERHASVVRYKAKQVPVQDGSPWDKVLLVLDGWLETVKSLSDGEVQIIDFVLPGDIIDPVAGDGRTAGLGVEALTNAEVVMFTQSTWRELQHDYPEIEDFAERSRAASRARTSERLLRLGKASAATRVTYALLEFCVRLRGCEGVGECSFHIPLTQKDIGDFTGLSSVHVCRTMRRLVRQNIVASSDHLDIRILDVGALSEIAQISPAELCREIVAGAR